MDPKIEKARLALERLQNADPWEWPSNAGESLKQILPDRQIAAAERTVAANLAGDLTVMDDEMALLLLALVLSPDEPEAVRAGAAISLGPALEQSDLEGFVEDLSAPPVSEQTFNAIQEGLHSIYVQGDAPKLVRRRVLEASVRAPQDWHRDAIRAAYSDKDEEWRETAVFGMGWVRGFDADIMDALRSRNAGIHYEAVRAAGAQEVLAAWPHIRALIASENTERTLRLAAIQAAGGVAPAEEADLLQELADSDDEGIAEAATDALMYVGLDEEDEKF